MNSSSQRDRPLAASRERSSSSFHNRPTAAAKSSGLALTSSVLVNGGDDHAAPGPSGDLLGVAGGGAHERRPGGDSLEEHQWRAFDLGAEDEEIGRRVGGEHLGSRDVEDPHPLAARGPDPGGQRPAPAVPLAACAQRPVPDHDQRAAAGVGPPKALDCEGVALAPVVRPDGEQQRLGRVDPVPLAEVRVRALELLAARAVRDDVQVLQRGAARELDVLVGAGVEDQLVEAPERRGQGREVVLIGAVGEPRETARSEDGPSRDPVEHIDQRVRRPLLGGVGHDDVKAAVHDEGAVTVDLSSHPPNRVPGDLELLDPRPVQLGLLPVGQACGGHRDLMAAPDELPRDVPDHGLGSPRTRVVELDAVQDSQSHAVTAALWAVGCAG